MKRPLAWRGPAKLQVETPLDRPHLRRLQALRPLLDLEAHALPLLQRLVAVLGDLREVDEHVVAFLAFDESEALLVAEPFDGSLWHFPSSANASLVTHRARRTLQRRGKPIRSHPRRKGVRLRLPGYAEGEEEGGGAGSSGAGGAGCASGERSGEIEGSAAGAAEGA